MKHLKYFSLVFWLILVTGLVLILAGCDTPIATPVSYCIAGPGYPHCTSASHHPRNNHVSGSTNSNLHAVSHQSRALVFLGGTKR